MDEVWLLFKFIEFILNIVCTCFHIRGFLFTSEPQPHNLFFCGTFAAFTMITLFGMVEICLSPKALPINMEAVINGCGAVMFIVASMLSMCYAENDFHLMYLSDIEEMEHLFFYYCKAQSVSALACGILHMLHAFYAVDALIPVKQDTAQVFQVIMQDSEEDVSGKLRLYFFGQSVHNTLLKYKWFRWLAEKK